MWHMRLGVASMQYIFSFILNMNTTETEQVGCVYVLQTATLKAQREELSVQGHIVIQLEREYWALYFFQKL